MPRNFQYGKTAHFVKFLLRTCVRCFLFQKPIRLSALAFSASALFATPPSGSSRRRRRRQRRGAGVKRLPLRSGLKREFTTVADARQVVQFRVFSSLVSPVIAGFCLFERKWRKPADLVLFTDYKSLYLHALKSGYPLLLK